MSVISRCDALGDDGAFCAAALDIGHGSAGETRLCADRLHRWRWTGEGWAHDLAFQPAGVAKDRCAA